MPGGPLPAPERSDLVAGQREYLIGPYDELKVQVYGIDELERTVQVDASGNISLPLVGGMDAAGKSPLELARAIETSLRGRYVRDPQVTVNVSKVNQLVTIDGQVKKPGMYPIMGKLTLMRSVALAEGAGDYADLKYVVVFRTVNAKKMAALYDLRSIRQGIMDDPELYANDLIYVGESRGTRLFQTFIQASPILTTAVLAVLN
ncbi:polysaccharide export protein [Sphingomonas sp. HITSZ_GF]|uniref:polysaccharide biosynthesis/export family protein n=1 Tax=Sphingomonas sp. HITSZ_GF TaxID=3037247 RepID=UPI00240D8D14|nr:polysaccharide biosynthesis/export family protein [Sphingomonas sp. HITSZ_GF]MDG2535780.1 polysaccharide export protein [Sphingomonas sp. HITSZ_GF]